MKPDWSQIWVGPRVKGKLAQLICDKRWSFVAKKRFLCDFWRLFNNWHLSWLNYLRNDLSQRELGIDMNPVYPCVLLYFVHGINIVIHSMRLKTLPSPIIFVKPIDEFLRRNNIQHRVIGSTLCLKCSISSFDNILVPKNLLLTHYRYFQRNL